MMFFGRIRLILEIILYSKFNWERFHVEECVSKFPEIFGYRYEKIKILNCAIISELKYLFRFFTYLFSIFFLNWKIFFVKKFVAQNTRKTNKNILAQKLIS